MHDVTGALASIRDNEPARVFIAATGAGAGIQKTLWEVPGVSKFLVGAAFPYAAEESSRLIGFTPTSFCSPDMALDLAMAAFMRAARVGARAVGVGLTAAVASREARRGESRAYAAYFGDGGAGIAEVTLPKDVGEDARRRDGEACDALGIATLLRAFGRDESGTVFEDAEAAARARLFARPYFRARGARDAEQTLPGDAVLFPGAFDPPHEGHLGGAERVRRSSGRAVVFATTVDPPHKAALRSAEVLRRAVALEGHDVLFTHGDPLYLDKARRFPGRGFVVGADALVRMLDPRWGVDVTSLVTELRALGAHFYVVPRLIDGSLVSLDDIRAMDGLGRALEMLSAEGVDGRWDVSSSAIRAAR